MKDQRYLWNPFRMISPKLNSDVGRIEELHKVPVSESHSPEESLLVMLGKLIEMTRILSACYASENAEKLPECEELAQEIHKQEQVTTKSLVGSSSSIGQNLFRVIVRFPSRIERIGMMFENILACCRLKVAEGIPFSDKAKAELAEIFAITTDMLINLRDTLVVSNMVILEHIHMQGKKLSQRVEDARFAHWDRLEAGYCSPQASALYLGILDSFKNINEYVNNMRESLIKMPETT